MDLHQSGLRPKTDIRQIRENCRDHAVKYVSNSDRVMESPGVWEASGHCM